ncbi:hypothetical protein CJ030_MR7G028095 [Morella rubra]|uniref:Uncharacterized protein n=1 Tax=Morella rubra TaxID=262757 RepID=A0A6A1V399_9ROSI|nr:hypothetical protein CJ030_MR7G028095 [Morella rubra]
MRIVRILYVTRLFKQPSTPTLNHLADYHHRSLHFFSYFELALARQPRGSDDGTHVDSDPLTILISSTRSSESTVKSICRASTGYNGPAYNSSSPTSPVMIFRPASTGYMSSVFVSSNPNNGKASPVAIEVIVIEDSPPSVTTSSKASGVQIKKGVKRKLEGKMSVELPTRKRVNDIARKLLIDTSTDTNST